MPHQTTYYTEEEIETIEREAEKQDKSFSLIVREAIQEKYGL